ncbi:amidohydrolase family protein [Leucobacter luti]|uniref:Imidazolonepropionase-like amidohydrolase n=1 Tax=Leucobacter luti TaxID=340320 RepID=A0A4Q7TZL6_9MICO|nr:amidohydrolase family protein [Leucobacter luti]MBL3699043.1 hypothetical protein [Leucobacter luti]RZT66545.1 imidazolonepropionase-like amidohydrolase [Leucobacter luti]
MDQGSTAAARAHGGLTAAGVIRGARVMSPTGDFAAPATLAWSAGRFLEGQPAVEWTGPEAAGPRAAGAADFDGTGLWVIPGIVDAHVHASWHAFDAADRELLGDAGTRAATAAGLARTLAAGITSVRDAGGLTSAALAAVPATRRPAVQLSVRMLDHAAAEAAGGLDRAVDTVLGAGAQWVKLVGTAGVAAPAGAGLDPIFTAAEVRDAVRRAGDAGAGVMVHAWGGAAIDDAIDAGATSIEHGIFLTPDQAARAAAAGLTLVPTLRIYHLVRRMIAAGKLPAAFDARVAEAVAAHPNAVRIARDAGLPIALGTDSGTPDQHGSAPLEFDALVAAGLDPAEALLAATRNGAALLARAAGGTEPGGTEPGGTEPGGAETGGAGFGGAGSDTAAAGPAEASRAASTAGTLAPGALADAVLLRRDPREPGALSDQGAVVRVLRAGVLLDPRELLPDAADPHPSDPSPSDPHPSDPRPSAAPPTDSARRDSTPGGQARRDPAQRT